MAGSQKTAPGIVALFGANDDTAAMVKGILLEAGNAQSLISSNFADLKNGVTDFEKYLGKYNPELVIFHISPPYKENWDFFKTIRDAAAMRGRGLVLTTTNRLRLDELSEEDSHALEIVGISGDLDRLSTAIQRERTQAVVRRATVDFFNANDDTSRPAIDDVGRLSREAMIIWQVDGTISGWNQAAERIFGYTAAEIIEQSVSKIIPPGNPDQWALISEQIREGGTIEDFATQWLKKDGGSCDILLTISPIQDESRSVVAVLCLGCDISDRKRLQSVERDHMYLAALISSADQAILGTDLDNIVITWNSGAEKIFGYKGEEIIGKPVAMLIPPDHSDELAEALEQIRRGDQVEPFETQRICKDGRLIEITLMVSPIKDEFGRLIGTSRIVHELTDRKNVEKARRDQLLLAAILVSADDAIISKDLHGIVTSWNDAAERVLGYTADEMVGQPVAKLIPPEHLDEEPKILERICRGDRIEHYETERTAKDGRVIDVSLTISPIKDGIGRVIGASEVARDMSHRSRWQSAEDAQSFLAALVDSAEDAIISKNMAGIVTSWNRAAETMFGHTAEAMIGNPISILIPPDNIDEEPHILDQVRQGKRIAHYETKRLHQNGGVIDVSLTVSPIRNKFGEIIGASKIVRDISLNKSIEARERRTLREAQIARREADEAREQMSYSAEHDSLTDLPNRLLMRDRIVQAIALARRHGLYMAILFLDLDGFKHINDSLGHTVGDKLLQSVAARLKTCIRSSDTVSRQGGDEFVILLSQVKHATDAAMSARRILAALARPHAADPHELYVTASIGLSAYPEDGEDAEVLLRNADTAMYYAKQKGHNQYHFFKKEMNTLANERQILEGGLRRALEREEFLLHFQPKIDLKTGAITGSEALLRWLHPDRGLVPPLEFIAIAEDSGLILEIGRWVLREACKQTRVWQDAGLPPLPVAINVSGVEFRKAGFLESIRITLKETGLDPRFLELELTESVLMRHAESTTSILSSLKAMGLRLAVDDFGTGYSSLSYLNQFPIDSLKVDQSFVHEITDEKDEGSIVSAVINMARGLGQRVIAEGVETAEQLAFLQARGCDEAQGYYFGRPMPAQQFAKLLESDLQISLHR